MKNCNLPPFKAFVLQNFPFIEEDFDALTYYEILCKLIEQLKLTDEQVAKITEIINNFDVQEEVDKKLDEMAEDGTLEELINQEIFGNINSKIDNLEKPRTILLGDSYGGIRNNVEGWEKRLQKKLGLSDNDCYCYYSGGGFVANTTFLELLQMNINNIQNKDTIKRIVVIGGDNDLGNSYNNIQLAMKNFETYVKQNFPNALIYIGMFMYSTNRNKFVGAMEETLFSYSNLASFDRYIYLNNIEYAIRDSNMLQDDGIHLNENGQKQLTQCIYNCLKNGSCENNLPPKFFDITLSKTPTSTTGYLPYIQRSTSSVSLCINNIAWDFDNDPYIVNLFESKPTIHLGVWNNSQFLPFESPGNSIQVLTSIHFANNWLTFVAELNFAYGGTLELYIPRFPDFSDVNIDHIEFLATSKEISSRLC